MTTETQTIKGIKSAVSDFNKWQGAARVYFNKSEMKMWTNVYHGPEQWEDYHDENIVEIHRKAVHNMAERDDKTSMKELAELAQRALNGETIYDWR